MGKCQKEWPESKVMEVFKRLDLDTQEKRNRFLRFSMAKLESSEFTYVTKLSNTSEPENVMRERRESYAKLERNP